jgi:hypothetical protein
VAQLIGNVALVDSENVRTYQAALNRAADGLFPLPTATEQAEFQARIGDIMASQFEECGFDNSWSRDILWRMTLDHVFCFSDMIRSGQLANMTKQARPWAFFQTDVFLNSVWEQVRR